MRNARRSTFVGLVALAMLVVVTVAGLAVAWDRGWLDMGGGQRITVRLDRAYGLRRGAMVTIDGLPVGRVRSVAFASGDPLDGGIEAVATLHPDLVMRRGCRATVVVDGADGVRVLELEPGPREEPPLESGAIIRGEAGSGAGGLPQDVVWSIERAADKIGLAADALAPVLSGAERLVEPRRPSSVDNVQGSPGNLSSTVARLDEAVRNLNELIGDPIARQRMQGTIENLHATAQDTRALVADARAMFAAAATAFESSQQLMNESRAAVNNISRRADDASEKLGRTLDYLATVLAQIEPVTARLARGEGTLGKMISDDRLHEMLMLSLRRMAETPGATPR